MYEVTAAPPVLLGAPHVSITTPSPSATCKFVGALAVAAAVATTEEEAAPPPTRLTANTFAVMASPLVSPVNVARLVAAVIVPPVYSTMYAVIAAPPLSTGALHCKVITPLPSCACKPVGAAGVVAAVATTGAEDAPPPTRINGKYFCRYGIAIG